MILIATLLRRGCFFRRELNKRLARSGENAMGLEAKSDNPPTCAARGLERGAKVAGM